MDENTCMVEVARFFMSFTQRESCGKCVPCREGTKRMLEILEKIVAGNGEMSDLDELEELAKMVQSSSLRTWKECTSSCPQYHEAFSRGIRRAYPGQEVPGKGLHSTPSVPH